MARVVAPLERGLPPVYRHLLSARLAVLMGRGGPRRAEDVKSVAYQTATSAFAVGATPVEIGGLLHVYVATSPQYVIRAAGAREDLVGPEGGLQPLGAAAGMVFAMLTRAL